METEKLYERLDVVMKKFRYDNKDIASIMGMKAQSFYTARAKGRGFKMDSIISLAENIPQLNLNWLLLGEGDMLRVGDEPQILKEAAGNYGNPAQDVDINQRLDSIEEKLEKIYNKLL